MAKKILSLCLLIFFVSGCAAKQSNYVSEVEINSEIVNDSARVMFNAHPPAQLQLALQSPVDDTFGILLVEKLRSLGYAIHEPFIDVNQKASDIETPDTYSIPFFYILDQINYEGGLYRVSIFVGESRMSRVYKVVPGGVIPSASWSYKE